MKNNYSRFIIIALITIILFLFVLTVRGYAAEKEIYFQTTISGKVVDKEGMPIPGVAVNIKKSNKGTVTNLDGVYNIEAASNAVLVFSYLGFKTQEIPVQGRSEINITIQEDVLALDEVEINAGYYNTTRRESTGNISRVTAEEIELQPVVSPLQALQGRMAGVEVIPGGSHPGMAPTIRIRGINSLRKEGNFPLYIIDGVPVNSIPVESNSLISSTGIDPLSSLNLNNIESIEVLKDADATAIYGSRGANGVVLITTKEKKGVGSFLEARLYHGAATMPERLDLLKTEEYLYLRQLAFENDEVEPTPNNAYDLVLWDQNRYTDWQEFFFGGSAEVTDISLAANGGNENTTYRLGGSYYTRGTIYHADLDYTKLTANLNLGHKSRDEKFSLNLSAIYGTDKNDLMGDVDLASPAFRLAPNAPIVFNEDGSLHWDQWDAAGLNNPLAGYFNHSTTTTNNLLANLGLNYRLAPGLNIKATAGYTIFTSNELVKRPSRSYSPAMQEPHFSFHLDSERRSWIIEPQISYDINFDEASIELLAGTTFQESTDRRQSFEGTGYVSEGVIGNLSAAEQILNGSSRNGEYRYSALFGRLATNWKGKYLLNLTGRRDGSSRFGPDKRFANFGAVGVAWLFYEEPFIKNIFPFLSFGKIRGSFGTTGNDQIGDYGFLDAYEATRGPGGLYPTQLSNPAYSWEENEKLEAAVDLGFFNNRLNAAVSWYRNQSSNQLVGYPLPATTGFNLVQANLPATVQNKGWEIEISSRNFETENFNWITSFNLTLPENKLVNYPSIDQSSYAHTYKVGHPLNISLRYVYAGIDPETGYFKIRDINDDGQVDHLDRTVIQDHGRQFYGGINNNLSFGNFSLQFLWEFAKQEGTVGLFNFGSLGAQDARGLSALSEDNPFQKISQSYQAGRAYNYILDTTFPIEDASFLRLKTLSIGYTFQKDIIEKIQIRNLRLFANAQNLFTISSYRGLDPGSPNSGTSFSAYRTITAGIELQL